MRFDQKRAYTFSFALCLAACSSIEKKAVISKARTQEQQEEVTPWHALQKLKLGNDRFMNNTQRERDLTAQVASSKKQFPFAVILSCMDSRGSPEIIFDQGIGDVFAERLAGNVINKDILGGMEFGTKITGAKLVVVLGHTSCGAIEGACEHAKLGNLTQLLNKIEPAVLEGQKLMHSKNCKNGALLNEIAELNVKNALKQIQKESVVLRELIQQGKVGLVGGMHDIATGKVKFFEDKKLLPGSPNS